MKKLHFATAMMMEMCMWIFQMCMAFCAYRAELFSISQVKRLFAK